MSHIVSAPRTPPWWFGEATPPWWARLLEPVYAGAVRLRRTGYRRGWWRAHAAGVPVVVVGSVLAGGSGKTPLALALVERLCDAGFHPGVASRGYGRADTTQARWVEATSQAAEVGDEPLLIARSTGVPVRVDADRVAAAHALAAAGCDVVVCDDGLQHLRLARDVEIEVEDRRRGRGNGRLLPAGPLREPLERAQSCDFRVLNLGDADGGQAAGFGQWPMRLQAGDAQALDAARMQPLQAFAGRRVHAVAGIADPERFFASLRAHGIAVVPHAFADHHAFTRADFDFASDLPVLMTSKDAVKCAGFGLADAWVVPVRALLPEAFWVALLDRLPAPAAQGHSLHSPA
jgi:tetraacyldisaccharide 4'-kinase